jgi:hypothetical protein
MDTMRLARAALLAADECLPRDDAAARINEPFMPFSTPVILDVVVQRRS